MNNEDFKRLLEEKGGELYRDMPWRNTTDPYRVMVSELMLQQTQVDRVVPKYEAFIALFPTVSHLAAASLAEVISLWQGLGYNRRARFLHMAAKQIVEEHNGHFPQSPEAILRLPGIGKNTLGAICAYAYNQPVVFVETNIRTVYLYHFFADSNDVTDAEIIQKLRETIDSENPRQFYWALMDYGSWLKRHGIRNISQSKHYKKQAPLKGSVREVRGQVLRLLIDNDMSAQDIASIYTNDPRITPALEGLIADGLVSLSNGKYHLTK